MRKLTVLCLCAILLLGPAGCGMQPAETSTPANTETQAETAALPSTAAEESSETAAADTLAEAPETEPSGAEETAEAPGTEESTEMPSAETADEPTEPSEETETECIVADTFRFTVPAGWKKQDNGSFLAEDGSVRIFFCTVPLSNASFSKGIKLKDKDFGRQLVAYFNEDSENEITYTVYDSPSADQLCRTAGGLDQRFILVLLSESSGIKGTSILSAYSLNKKNVLVIWFEYGLSSGVAAEKCWEAVSNTIERIK